jgi:hypothetical protein
LRNSKLNVRRSEKLRIADKRRKIGCLRRKSGDWLRRRRFGNERRRQSGGGRRRKNRKRLEEAEKEYAKQRELEKVRLEKGKAVEIEESGEWRGNGEGAGRLK